VVFKGIAFKIPLNFCKTGRYIGKEQGLKAKGKAYCFLPKIK